MMVEGLSCIIRRARAFCIDVIDPAVRFCIGAACKQARPGSPGEGSDSAVELQQGSVQWSRTSSAGCDEQDPIRISETHAYIQVSIGRKVNGRSVGACPAVVAKIQVDL